MQIELKSIIKNRLPKSAKVFILELRDQMLLVTTLIFSQSRFLASLYYCFLSSRFSREHKAVLKGRLLYLRNKGMHENTSTLLRRNIHRIEKGLIMRPQKTAFALDYIQETVCAYHVATNNKAHDQQELRWAGDVLSSYFSVVQLTLLDPAIKEMFDAAHGSETDDGRDKKENAGLKTPYPFSSKIQAQITPQQLSNLCLQRRSVRWFEQKPVARGLLEQAVEIAALAPSACNRLPYKFYIADEGEASQKLISIPLGTKGFAENVPCTIVVAADLGSYPSERDRHLIYIDSSLACMQLMLALETLGLSSCPINWPDIEEKEQEMASLLGLGDNIRPIILIAVGYACPGGKVPYSQKKSAEQLICYVNH